MNEFLQMFKEEQKLLKKIKKKKEIPTSVFISLEDRNTSIFDNVKKKSDSKNDIYNTSIRSKSSNNQLSGNNSINVSNDLKLSNTSSSHSISNGIVSTSTGGYLKSSSKNNFSSKGGVVIYKQSIIVKTNFEMAGRLNKNGKRPTSKDIGSHASASMNYIDNHGAIDIEASDNLSNTYHENGDRLTKKEFKELQSDIKEDTQAFRRIIIDVGQKDFNREDLNKLVRESMQQFKEDTGKDFDFKFALHFDTEQPHAHVIAYGSNADINFTKEHLQNFKEIVGVKTEEIILEKSLEHDHDLSLNQQIDKELDGILDQKIENDHSHELDNTKGLAF